MLLLQLLLLSGCLNEDVQPQTEQRVKGRIVLSTEIEGYTDVETRSVQSLTNYTGYTYTLASTSTLVDGSTFNQTGNLSDLMSAASLELVAGNYRLTVTNESATQTGIGFPIYSGYQEFTLHVDATETVSIFMGKPKNAKVTIILDNDNDNTAKDTFAELYEDAQFTIGSRTINLATGAAGTIAYFPAGSVSYTISASAQSGSHVTDIAGATGSISLTAGCAHTITLSANSVTGEIIPVVSGTHTGTFD